MTPLQFRAADLHLAVNLADSTIQPLVGELAVVSPRLADKVQQAAFDVSSNVVLLDEEEVEFLAAAALVVSKSVLDDDPELDRLAGLRNASTPPTWSDSQPDSPL
jgi:hypothetical protein